MAIRARDREMMLDPKLWPHLWLPLKRKNSDGFPQIALLEETRNHKENPLMVHINGSLWHSRQGEIEVVEYPDVDAVLDDGWIVD